MNEVELLVHGREVTLEQQKAVHARVIWYVPCTSQNAILAITAPLNFYLSMNYIELVRPARQPWVVHERVWHSCSIFAYLTRCNQVFTHSAAMH